MSSSSSLLYVAAFAGFAGIVLPASAQPAGDLPPVAAATVSADTFDYEAAHEAAKWRKRRVIQNNDGGESRVPRQPIRTPEDLLKLRALPLVGSQVDTIIYDTTAGTFGMYAHTTQVAEEFRVTEGRYRNNALISLQEQGTDPLQVMIDFSRANDIEILWSMRMNDTHDASNALLLPQFKKDNPNLLFGGAERRRPRHGGATGVDYTQPEVRDLAFRIVEEVAQNYDVDGVHLDFFRHPVFFKSVAQGGVATDEQREMMTDLIRKIREMLLAEGKKRGKPLLLTVRVPDSVEFCRQIGLDIEAWLAEGLLDALSTTCYFQLNPWSYSVELGHRYNVPVYPSLSESRIAGADGEWASRRTEEVYRARAANVWASGADGVYIFNSFNGSLPWWHQIGDTETLAGLNKRYFATVRGPDYRRFLTSDTDFASVDYITPDAPQVLDNGKPMSFSIEVGEDFDAAFAKGLEAEVVLRLDIRSLETAADAKVSLNGRELGGGTIEDGWLVLPLDPNWLRTGSNEIELMIAEYAPINSRLRETYPAIRTKNRLRIRELEVSLPKDKRELKIDVRAEGTGDVRPGSLSIRTPNRAGEDPVPPGFVTRGGYTYPPNWVEPGWLFDKEGRVSVRIPISKGKAGVYNLRLIAQQRPLKDSHVRDDRLFSFELDDQGNIGMVRALFDAHIDVRYTPLPQAAPEPAVAAVPPVSAPEPAAAPEQN